MNITEMLFLLCFIGFFAIFLYRTVNLSQMGRLYRLQTGFILYIVMVLTWFINYVVFLTMYEDLLIRTLYRFQTFFLLLGFFYLVGELLLEFQYATGMVKEEQGTRGRMVR